MWKRGADFCKLEDVNGTRMLYCFPSPHMFYKATLDSESALRQMHHWLRIRAWCLQQVIHGEGSNHGMVLLTTPEWEIALNGNYTRIVDLPDAVRPKSSQHHIESLPVREGEYRKPSTEKKKKDSPNQLRARARNLAARVDINVRFGVIAGFKSHDACQQNPWGKLLLTEASLKNNRVVFQEVVWELSILNFRLEVLHVDRIRCPHLYQGSDHGLERSMQVARVWSEVDGLVAPSWQHMAEVDDLSASDLSVRGKAWRRFAVVLADWSHAGWVMEGVPRSALESDVDQVSDFYQVLLVQFYLRYAHTTLRRLPTLPLSCPQSLASHSKS